MENNYKSGHICLKQSSHKVYALSVQIVTMLTMWNVSMQTEKIYIQCSMVLYTLFANYTATESY